MIFPESLLVVVACTLSGGVERGVAEERPQRDGNGTTCGVGSRWRECTVLDEEIQPLHLTLPWVVTLGTVVVLSMPTVLLRSKRKAEGLGMVAWNLFQCLGLMLCSSFLTDHPSICFTLTLHSCILLLGHMEVSKPLVGAEWWWFLRHPVGLGLLFWEVAEGPPVSVVRWPDTPAGSALPCAYLAHLAGAILPDCILLLLRGVLFLGRCMCFRED
jgi:hypothetical protein